MNVYAKTFFIDVATVHGTEATALSGIRFYYQGNMLDIALSDFTSYATSLYPGYVIENVFVSTQSLIGAVGYATWCTAALGSQRIGCVFQTPILFDEIRVCNFHINGNYTFYGSKDVKIYVHPTEAITNSNYGEALDGTTLIFDGIFEQHDSTNTPDLQVIFFATPSFIQGTVSDGENGLSREVVLINKSSGLVEETTESDSSGDYRFENINDDEYLIAVFDNKSSSPFFNALIESGVTPVFPDDDVLPYPSIDFIFDGSGYSAPLWSEIVFSFKLGYEEICEETFGITEDIIFQTLFLNDINDAINIADSNDLYLSLLMPITEGMDLSLLGLSRIKAFDNIYDEFNFNEVLVLYIPTGVIQLLSNPFILSQINNEIVQVSEVTGPSIVLQPVQEDLIILTELTENILITEVL